MQGRRSKTLATQTCDTHREPAKNNKPESPVSALHPGGGNLLKCNICNKEVSTNAALVKKHLRIFHQTCISEYICVCTFSGDSALSVGTHKR